ncbi:hypothetical protein BGX28_009546 [Mortierella sp. GBA30]|nr:hypothetical protein BGX28_009546 [Mortierella sp. GBA30]
MTCAGPADLGNFSITCEYATSPTRRCDYFATPDNSIGSKSINNINDGSMVVRDVIVNLTFNCTANERCRSPYAATMSSSGLVNVNYVSALIVL